MLSRAGSIILWGILCLSLSGTLTGCTVASLVGANSEPAPVTKDLLAVQKRGLGHLGVQLSVNEPTAVEAFSNSRIAIKPGPQEVSYFPAAVWTDKLPRLLQLRLVESFENSRILKAVSTGSDRIKVDLALSWEIRDFQIEVNGKSAQAHVRLFVKLIDEDEGQLISEKEVSATVRAHSDDVDAGVEALKEAFSSATIEIMRWIVSRRLVVVETN